MDRRALALPLTLILVYGCAEMVQPTKRPDMRNAIRLKSRTFVPVGGLERKLPDYFKEQETLERIHVLVQFDRVPSIQDRQALARRMKVRVLDPVPERAFFASMPNDMSAAKYLVDKRLVRWIGRIQPEDKVAPWLLKKGVPAHARRDKDKVELIVQFFGDVDQNSQRQVLKRHGAKALTRVVPLNGWHVLIDEARILGLAGEDAVKWIVEIPMPPEDINDEVRSGTGVNADPLHGPAEYGLSGAGVTVAQWETWHASFVHNDYAGRLTFADPPLSIFERPYMHDESVTVNGQFDNGENVYWDMDEDGSVSANDVRGTTVGGSAAGSTVAAGDGDNGNALIIFADTEWYGDTVHDSRFTDGEGIYLDNDASGNVSAGDTRVTPVGAYAAGSVVSAGPPADADVGTDLDWFTHYPHYHSTHVAGTVLGDGSQSVANGGTAQQWKGVAPGASLRSYRGFPPTASTTGDPVATDEYTDAANNGVAISTNSWRTGRTYQITAPHTSYETGSQYYDSVVSNRRSDGTSAGLARRILVVAAAGNEGRYPELYVDNTPGNGRYDNGEGIYWDIDGSWDVSAGDRRETTVAGFAAGSTVSAGPPADADIGTLLSNFNSFEMHDESLSTSGTYNSGEGIYIDADSSRTITTGDSRITAPAASGYADGSIVAGGDTDVDGLLKWFRPFATLGIPNSSKNTLEVASIASDTKNLSAYSSRGLSYDGRFKPDVSGPGCQEFGDGGVTSAWPGNSYGTICGTSMATPAVAGGAALLEEWYRTACSAGGSTPDIIRALLIHSAEDLTDIPNVGSAYVGPDFAFGYGRVRIKEAVDLMPHYRKGTAAGPGSTNYTFTIGAMNAVKVTLVWDDPPWIASTAPSAITGLLQNDLDLLVIAPDGTQYTPWVADATNLFAPATKSTVPAGTPVPASAEDHRNNVEQVVVVDAAAGTWTIRVTASGLNLPPQDYVVVSEVLPPNTTDCTANPAADVWVKDNPTDDGTVPSSGSMYLGQDIWNRLTDDGLTTHDNPVFGQTNYLYARIRNNSAVEVKSTVMDAWISTLAIGLVWPDGFVHVGRFNIPNLGPGEVRQVGPIEWSPHEVGHHCMYTRVSSPQDPITFAETTSVWTNAKNSNNIAYKNMTIVDLTSSKTVSFLLRNILKKEADVDIVIRTPDELLTVGEVLMKLSPALEEQWPKRNRKVDGLAPVKGRYHLIRDFEMPTGGTLQEPGAAMRGHEIEERELWPQQSVVRLPIYKLGTKNTVLKGIHMRPRQAERMALTFSSRQTTKATYHVHVTQQVKGETVGGIVFVVRTGYRAD